MSLQDQLPQITQGAVAWAQAHAARIAKDGESLSPKLIGLAKKVGVLQPELIRILRVPTVPFPEEPMLREAARQTGLVDGETAGLTLGHGIYVVSRHETVRLLSHEFRHVHQYEAHGGIAGFLEAYLRQIVAVGYSDAPLEIDARRHERTRC